MLDNKVRLIRLPVTVTSADYHRNQAEIDDMLVDLQELEPLLSPRHKATLLRLSGGGRQEAALTIDHIQNQYELVMKIRDRLLDDDGELLLPVDTRALGSLITSTTALMGLYLRSQEKINHLREIANLRSAVIAAVAELSEADRARFFLKYDEMCS